MLEPINSNGIKCKLPLTTDKPKIRSSYQVSGIGVPSWLTDLANRNDLQIDMQQIRKLDDLLGSIKSTLLWNDLVDSKVIYRPTHNTLAVNLSKRKELSTILNIGFTTKQAESIKDILLDRIVFGTKQLNKQYSSTFLIPSDKTGSALYFNYVYLYNLTQGNLNWQGKDPYLPNDIPKNKRLEIPPREYLKDLIPHLMPIQN